jgi:hypothetical protein
MSHDGSELPKPKVGADLDLWEHPFEAVPMEKAAPQTVVHAGSQQIGNCLSCGGAKDVTCPTCEGTLLAPGKAS